MQKDRNSLRKSIIGWIKSRVNQDVDHVSYKGLLLKYFNMFDADKDEKLDTMEFVKLVELDVAMAKVLNVSWFLLEEFQSNPSTIILLHARLISFMFKILFDCYQSMNCY